MKDNYTQLYPNEAVGRKVCDYSDKHSKVLSDALIKYHEWVVETQPRSNFTISLLQARVLSWLTKTVGAKRVLEIGTYVGFSAAVWADAVGKDGFVTGLERSAEYSNVARDKLKGSGWTNTEIIEGDALETLEKLNPKQPYDIIFIDAQKSGYPRYLEIILSKSRPEAENRLLRPGGLIIGDNVLRAALVVDRTAANPATETVPKKSENWDWDDVQYLDEFNKAMNTNPRVDAVLLPLFDGLGIGRLLD